MLWSCCCRAYIFKRSIRHSAILACLLSTGTFIVSACTISSFNLVSVQIPFSKENIEDMLRISDRLQVIPVKDACAVWLEKELDAYNVLEVLLLWVFTVLMHSIRCITHASPTHKNYLYDMAVLARSKHCMKTNPFAE